MQAILVLAFIAIIILMLYFVYWYARLWIVNVIRDGVALGIAKDREAPETNPAALEITEQHYQKMGH